MDFHLDHQQSDICIKHSSPIVIINNDGHFCVICLQQLPGNISIEQFKQQQQKIIDQIIKQIDLDRQLFQDLLDQSLKFKNAVILSLDKICQQIQDQIRIIKESESKISIIRQSNNKNQQSMLNELELVSNKQQQFNKDAKDWIRKQLQSFQLQFAEINQFYPFLEDKQIAAQQQDVGMIQNKVQIKEVEKVRKGVTITRMYQEFQMGGFRKYTHPCYSFAFNKDNTILVIGQEKEIINRKRIVEIKQSYQICQLLILYEAIQFFCFWSRDNSIIIWILDKDNKWIVQQQLKEHDDSVNCILMNKMEDQLTSGSGDCALKFWRKKAGSWTFQQSISTKLKVLNVSLNEKEDKLIVCENNWELYRQTTQRMSCIQVLISKNNEQWNLMQTIDIPEHGYRLSFTIGDQFVFATTNSDSLQVYDYDTGKGQFIVVSQIKIQNVKDCCGLFPCQFIKSQNILTYKHGRFLNIIKVNEKQKYELMQPIELDNKFSIGRLTNDGQYLVTWDSKSEEVQIRKIKKQE